MYDNLKYFRKGAENGDGLFTKAAFPSLKTGTTAASIHRIGKIRCDELILKINLKTNLCNKCRNAIKSIRF